MELAIPLVALGGMYIISNKNNKSGKKENFTANNTKGILKKGDNSSKSKNVSFNREPFVNKIDQTNNYQENHNATQLGSPVLNYPTTKESSLLDTVQYYPNPNTATDKYFDQNLYQTNQNQGKKVGANIQEIYSLSGNYMDSTEFKHNNMVPFFGGKLKGQIYNNNNAETILDNYVGSGSQQIKKIEQAPLFKPQENVQWAYGAPNMSDFYQSRVNPGMKNHNVKPFESENVGPGLAKGYNTYGSGGFNSGMEAREVWLPKTVDELRIATNPKEEFSLINHEGPADSSIKNVGILGKVEKYRPDTFFINTQDRWLTTTGAEKATRLVPEEILKNGSRHQTTTHLTGTPNSHLKTASYVPGKHTETKRIQLEGYDVSHSHAAGRGPIDDGDNHMKSHTNYMNNRAGNDQPDTIRSGFSRAIGAVIAPIMDIMKPSRKEEYSCNVRTYGNMTGEVPHNYVLDTNDVTPTTIKETTLYTPHGYIGNQINGAYQIKEIQTNPNQRDTTNCSTFTPVGGSGTRIGERSYHAEYLQTNNESKEKSVVGRTNMGNAKTFNPYINVSTNRLDSDRESNRFAPAGPVIPSGPSMQTYGKMNAPQYYDECYSCSRIQPDILNAFRDNPYTHSLTYSV